MNFHNVYSKLYETMRYFHSLHQQQLLSLQEQCKKATKFEDLRSLASGIHSFCHDLHLHHTIEDQHLFPSIARKTNISHLETHHEQLSKMLVELDTSSIHLKQIKNSPEDIQTALIDVSSLINKASALIIEHETAEEEVIAPENMRKLFTEQEIRQLF